MNKFEKARQNYKPEVIDYLFVAETPPKSDSNRFFYFEKVDKQDSLFLETMKFLYPYDTQSVVPKTIRSRKKMFLERFQQDGFYLIDSLDQPFDRKYSTLQKVKLIEKGQERLLAKIRELLSDNTKVVLIAVPVYKTNFRFLKQNDIPVINEEPIDFPGSGGQKKFRDKMHRIIK